MTGLVGIEIRTPQVEHPCGLLSTEALEFIRALHDKYDRRRRELLEARAERRAALALGATLDFLPETASIREGDWQVAPPAPGLIDRRVEITGPTDRKMSINALNSGANVWMADFEDSNAPTWENLVGGQRNLLDAVKGRLELVTDDGRQYAVGDSPATIVVRPRGLHMVEKHMLVDGMPVSASLFDFGLFLFHCGQRQIEAGYGPYFYLPKLEHHLEARWWNDVFIDAQQMLGIPVGTIRATVLIETITAAFQMEEILYELREHSSGLNAGRWDYLFSIIKQLGHNPQYVLPDRSSVTMTVPFMRAYTRLLVATCHRRGAHAIGGMSAFIPTKDPQSNETAMANVRADKQREANDGFDGSWVAHPGLVAMCREAFDEVLGNLPNQVERQFDPGITASDLLSIDQTPGAVTREGLVQDITVTLRYFDSWLRGTGAAAIDNLMEDAATAEISRSQLRQWAEHHTRLPDGTRVTPELLRELIDQEYERLDHLAAPGSRLADARELLLELLAAEPADDFFTVRAYELLLREPALQR